MLERSRRVVLLIDYDNLQICASRDTPGRDLQLTPVVQLAQKYGTVILARAYAEWNLSTERLAVYKAGIEPAFAPVLRTESDRSGKSLADTVMVAEGMDMLWTLSPEVVVLATSDKDLIPLVRVAKQRGAYVVVLGSDFTAIPLREMADDHITYKQLITDASGRYTSDAGSGRAPATQAEPTRRRTTRERNGREPSRGTTASAATTPAPTRTEPREGRLETRETREPRAEPRDTRPEREATSNVPAPVPAAAAPAAGASGPGTAEPVAPVAASMTGDVDGGMGTRRRRRRGSRRRSERLGIAGDGSGNPDGPDGGDDDASFDDEPTSAADVTATAPEAPAVEAMPEVVAEAAPAAEPEVEAAPAPRERRRRTTRRTPAAAAAEETASASDATPPAAEVTPPEPAAEPAPPEADAEAPPAEDGATTTGRRPRRVASAARGRTRSVR